MPACCIAYTTDPGYMFPTFVSAIQARHFSSPGRADVIIFCFGLDSAAERVFAPICETEGIGLMSLGFDAIEGGNAMLSRLFLNRFVPESYTQYLYMDGDIQIRGSLDLLIDTEVPEGRFLAANDPVTFLLADRGAQSRDLVNHMRSIGLSDDQAGAYFNSGVLRINRRGWDVTGESAWAEFVKNDKASRFPDQDVLNIVAKDKRIPMSLAWNFPIFMRNSRVEKEISPHVYHFMSNPKPWHGAFQPWTDESCKPYKRILRVYPKLEPFYRSMPSYRQYLYHMKQAGKKVIETVTWGFSERRNRILNYEAECSV